MSQRQYLNSLKCEVILEIQKLNYQVQIFFLIREEKTLQEI